MRIRRFAHQPLLAAAVAGCIVCSAPAWGQNSLQPATIQAAQLTEAQKTEIGTFVSAQLPLLGDPDKLKSARETLLAPLQQSGISPTFRQEFWGKVAGTVKTMIKSSNDQQVVNGLRIAGEIATDSSVELIPEQLHSKKASVRFAASFAIMRCFEETQGNSPALSRDKAIELVTQVSEALKTETDPNCLDSQVRALTAASPDKQQVAVQGDAVKNLARAISARLQRSDVAIMDERTVEVTVRAITTIRDSFTRATPPAWANDGVEAAGDALAYVYRVLRKPGSPLSPVMKDDSPQAVDAKKDLRRIYTPLVSVSESTVYLGRKFVNADANQTAISRDFKEAEKNHDGTALTDMNVLLKEKLPKEFGLAATRFVN